MRGSWPRTVMKTSRWSSERWSSWRASGDRKSTRLNSSHDQISYAVFCLKKKKTNTHLADAQQRATRGPPRHTDHCRETRHLAKALCIRSPWKCAEGLALVTRETVPYLILLIHR